MFAIPGTRQNYEVWLLLYVYRGRFKNSDWEGGLVNSWAVRDFAQKFWGGVADFERSENRN